MKFLDEANIYVKAGDGGRGIVSFFPKAGGPDGGDGGKGGSIIFKATGSKNTLIDFKYKTKYVAKNGVPGGTNNRTGADAADLFIVVPTGTIIKDKETGKILFDLDSDGKEVVLLEGGAGGKGNAFFCTPSRQAPDFAQPGVLGKDKWVSIELKLLADVGLVGLPNAGKSTLISRISAAKPKIADYPFTTLIPNLGVAKYGDMDFVVADVPGLIEGAHKGVGLGTRFLKHIERTKLLLHLVDVSFTAANPLESINIINNELQCFSNDVAQKPMLYVLNKIDSANPEILLGVKQHLETNKIDYIEISAVTGEGVELVLRKIYESLKKV
jgi:GTPase